MSACAAVASLPLLPASSRRPHFLTEYLTARIFLAYGKSKDYTTQKTWDLHTF